MTHEFDGGKPEKIDSIEQIDTDQLKRGSIKLEKDARTPHPTEWDWGLESSVVGFAKDANEMYRSNEPRNTIQVREYDDYYLIQLDHAHPTQNPVAHYKYDISPKQKVGLAIGAIAVGAAALFGAAVLGLLS